MSLAQPAWLSVGSTERPITLTPRCSNSGFSLATTPSSVVQTGVKSLGWENSTTQEFPAQLWKLIGPSVESCVKSGAMSLSCKAISDLLNEVKVNGPAANVVRRRDNSHGDQRMLLHQSTWQEVEAFLARSKAVIVPIGSNEQHGPTGLLGTDWMCPEIIAHEAQKSADVLV